MAGKASEKEQYVAYISSYTSGNKNNNYGIRVYDVDLENGYLKEKDKVEITNSSYLTVSHNHKYLYSITDFGVEAYTILEDGTLETINTASINGMRGCYVSTDYTDRYLFTAGYHDGKITVLRLNEDGSIGEITEEIYCKGIGMIADRNYRPHVTCVKSSRDNNYVFAADLGMDHVNVYELNHTTGKLHLMDIIRSDQDSAPRMVKFSLDGRFVYILHEIKNSIDVYEMKMIDGNPEFERIQSIPTVDHIQDGMAASSGLTLTFDFKYLVSSAAGDNSVVIFEIDHTSGLLTKRVCLPIAGEYPKDAALFPDNKHLISLNHDSNTMTFFNVDLKKGLLMMHGKEIPVDAPNCVVFHKLHQ
ncbi:MAG: lactonase family protein [Lachnospiraceae bacterium]|nr:lactonase family protein [Lachnospiraceae bacterium]